MDDNNLQNNECYLPVDEQVHLLLWPYKIIIKKKCHSTVGAMSVAYWTNNNQFP